MVTEKQLMDEVRAALHEEVADVTASATLLSTVHRKIRRRRVTRGLLVAAAAAAVVAVVTLPPAKDAPPVAETPPSSAEHTPAEEPPPPVNVALATERTVTALGEVTDDVIYERAVVTKGDKYSAPGVVALYERWLAADGTSFRLRVTVHGRPVVDLSRDTVSDVFVDYRTSSFRVFPGVEPNPPRYDDVWTQEEIRQSLVNGDLAVVGPGEPVEGRPTILMHHKGGKAEVPMDLWVDAETYLPVRWQWQQENSTPFDVTYLPPTPENRAELTTEIPPGFTQGK